MWQGRLDDPIVPPSYKIYEFQFFPFPRDWCCYALDSWGRAGVGHCYIEFPQAFPHSLSCCDHCFVCLNSDCSEGLLWDTVLCVFVFSYLLTYLAA